jgi:hypothetical protein
MDQKLPSSPQEPPNGQHLFGQQQWKQDLPSFQQSRDNQSTQATSGQFQRPPSHNYQSLRRQSGIWQWYRSRTTKVKVSIGCGMILACLLFFSCIGTSVGIVNRAIQSNPTPLSNQVGVTSPVIPTHPRPTPTSMTTPAPPLQPALVPTPTPNQLTGTPTPCPGANCNPWGYNFTPGTLIYVPPATFCSYFSCIHTFTTGHGYVVECKDNMFSKSGGLQGACTFHGGVQRRLYAH